VSDESYPVLDFYGGDWRAVQLRGRFPGNFVCETEDTEAEVVGESCGLPNTNKAYYRVVAVDAHSKRSWSSEYVAAPRPFITVGPTGEALAGAPYVCQLRTIRSLGALGYRAVTEAEVPDFWPPEERAAILAGFPWNRQVEKFWDVEEPRFRLVEGPAWLTLDAGTGLLRGTPDAPGRVQVIVEATLRRTVDTLDPEQLAHGRRVVVDTWTEVLGPDRVAFVIEVRA
jgi:hypothetical protein